MNWRRRRRLAWMLFMLSCVLALAVPMSMIFRAIFSSPIGYVGMCYGMFGFLDGGPQRVDWEFEYRPVAGHTEYLLFPTADGPRFSFTIPTWMVFAAVSALTVFAFRRSRIPPGHCSKCGYNLTGNVSGVCPECGTATNGESRRDD